MTKAPDHIFIRCPKCKAKNTVYLADLMWQHFACSNCQYAVTTDPATLAEICAAHDLWAKSSDYR